MTISIERYDRDWFPAPLRRFVDAVELGTVLKTTEFAGVVSVTVSNLFRDAGICRFDSGAPGSGDLLAMLLFQAQTQDVEQGIAAFVYGSEEQLTKVEAFSKTITPGGVN